MTPSSSLTALAASQPPSSAAPASAGTAGAEGVSGAEFARALDRAREPRPSHKPEGERGASERAHAADRPRRSPSETTKDGAGPPQRARSVAASERPGARAPNGAAAAADADPAQRLAAARAIALADPVDVGDDAPAGMPSPVEDAEVEDAARALDPLLTALLGQRAAAAEEEGGPAIGGPALATVGTGPTATRTDDGATVTGTARGRAAAAGRLSVAVDTPAGQRAAASSAVADARRMAELDALHGGASPTADAAAATAVAERLREGAPGVTGVTGATGAAAGGASPLAALAAASGTTAVVHAASNVTAGVVEGRLSAAPGQAGFAPELGAQLTLFVREGVQMARLQLHPAELGPVLVQIQLDGQAAQVHLAAENPFTRDKLGEALPVLAGSLREAGLTLSGGGVFEQPRRDDSAPGQGTSTTQGRNDDAARPEAADAGAQVVALPRRRGVVDLVA